MNQPEGGTVRKAVITQETAHAEVIRTSMSAPRKVTEEAEEEECLAPDIQLQPGIHTHTLSPQIKLDQADVPAAAWHHQQEMCVCAKAGRFISKCDLRCHIP